MNADTEKLLDQLELATSHVSVDEGELDDETRTLREGWLAFERALQGSAHPDKVPASASSKFTNVNWQTYWTHAVSILLFVALIGASLTLSSTALQPAKSQFAQVNRGSKNGSAAESINSEFAWDDSLDSRLAAASLALRQASQDREVYDWYYLRGELRAIRDELTGSSL